MTAAGSAAPLEDWISSGDLLAAVDWAVTDAYLTQSAERRAH